MQRQRVQAHLSILPHRLLLASLAKDKVVANCHPLIQLIFLNKSPEYFFSYTENEDEISLVLPEAATKLFTPGVLKIEDSVWRAIEVSEGSAGYNPNQVGVVHTLSQPLADAGLPIFYLSTFDADFVLIEETHLESGLSCLRRNFTIVTEAETHARKPQAAPLVPVGSPPQKRLRLAVLPEELAVLRVKRDGMAEAALPFLELLFFRPADSAATPPRFISWTVTEQSASMVLPRRVLAALPTHCTDVMGDSWQLLKVDEGPLGFTSCGIVASIAMPLSSLRLPLFYISTFLTDYVLVRKPELETAVNKLEQSFTIQRRLQ